MWVEIEEVKTKENTEYLTCSMIQDKPKFRKFRVMFDGFWFDEDGQCEAPTHIWR